MTRIIRLKDTLARTGDTRSPHYEKVSKGLFTRPVKIGGERAAGYPEHEVDALIAAWVAGATTEQVKRLVEQLHMQRAAGMPSLVCESAGDTVCAR